MEKLACSRSMVAGALILLAVTAMLVVLVQPQAPTYAWYVFKSVVPGVLQILERKGEYTHHLRHGDIPTSFRFESNYAPRICPEFIQPDNIHVIVINMDRSVHRLNRMRKVFEDLGLPMFERFSGIVPEPGRLYSMPQLDLPVSDFGCALSHRGVWKRIIDGPHEWVVVLEDDRPPLTNTSITKFSPIPKICDMVFLSDLSRKEPVCATSKWSWVVSGYGTYGYLIRRNTAARLLRQSAAGMTRSIDLWLIDRYHLCAEVHGNTLLNFTDQGSVRLKLNTGIDTDSDDVPADVN